MDSETEKLLDRLARERGTTKSDVLREAVKLAAQRESRRRRAPSPYDLFDGIVGSVRGGPPDLSEHTGEAFRHLLAGRVGKRT